MATSSDKLLFSDLAPPGDSMRGAVPWTVVPLWDATRTEPRIAAIAADVALDQPRSLALLRDALNRHRYDSRVPVVFLVRDRDVATYASANALGATHILPLDAPAAVIVETMRMPWLACGATAGEPVVARSDSGHARPLALLLDTVESTLQSALDAGRAHKPVPADALHRGADALVAAIKDHCIRDWINVVRRHDDSTYQHVLLVAGLVTAFAMRLGFTPARQSLLAQAALVHDIGKSVIPQEILNKPSALSPSEMELMRTHPARGYYMIAHQPGIDALVLDVVLHHHEYLDGSGYPHRLRRHQIGDAVRLVTICDIHAALIERRAYKAPMSPAESYAILRDMGDKLDRSLLDAFHDIVEAC